MVVSLYLQVCFVCVCVLTNLFLWIGTKEWYKGKWFSGGMEKLEKFSLFLTPACPCCILFAGWKEAGAGCVMGVCRWSSCCRRQNKGNKSFQSSLTGSETPDQKDSSARGSAWGFNKGGSCWTQAVNDREAAILLVQWPAKGLLWKYILSLMHLQQHTMSK